MTQFQHTLKQLLAGEKTETSRLALPEPDGTGEYDCEMLCWPGGQLAVGRIKANAISWKHIWITGKDYAIVPRRGVHSVGRYRVEAIWRQDVRTLTAYQIASEGFMTRQEFLETWCKMHDSKALPLPTYPLNGVSERPAERYQAWRMTISVLWETVDWNAPAVRALQIEPHPVN